MPTTVITELSTNLYRGENSKMEMAGTLEVERNQAKNTALSVETSVRVAGDGQDDTSTSQEGNQC
jgi:hypothetical protein